MGGTRNERSWKETVCIYFVIHVIFFHYCETNESQSRLNFDTFLQILGSSVYFAKSILFYLNSFPVQVYQASISLKKSITYHVGNEIMVRAKCTRIKSATAWRRIFSKPVEGASICPVFKNVDERSSSSQYRPINLFSIISVVWGHNQKEGRRAPT